MRRKGKTLWTRAKRAMAELFGQSDYAAAENNRLLSDWVTLRKSVDDEVRWSAIKLRGRARDLERNNALIRNYLRILHTNVIGPDGFRLQALVRNNDSSLNKLLNDRIEDAWCAWCCSPTLDGRLSMTALQRLLLKGVARDGEAFVRLWRAGDNPYGLSLEYIDPDLIDELYNVYAGEGGNVVRMGIELDGQGRPVAYHVWDRMVSTTQFGPRVRQRIPADQIIHLYEPDRAHQTRGVSWLASIMVPAQMLDKYVEAELVSARMGASKMGFFERDMESGAAPVESKDGNLTMEFNPGTFGVMPDGYSLSAFDPTHPSGTFGVFVKDATRRIAVGLGVSYNGMASDLEGVNYSSMRSGLLIERDVFRTLQTWWRENFIQPVYREWLSMALLTGGLKMDSRDPRKFMPAKWTPRGWAWVDPLKDTQAGVLGIQNGLTSRTSLLAEQGLDFEDVLEALAEEKAMAEDYGIDLSPQPAVTAGQADTVDAVGDTPDEKDDTPTPSKNGHALLNRVALHGG